MNKTVFVTGGAGFIGRELTRKLLKSGCRVVCFDVSEQFYRHAEFFEDLREPGNLNLYRGTILDKTSLQAAMRSCDSVFHLAAMLGVKRTEDNRLRCLEINATGTDYVLNACVFNDVKHVVYASSSEVYGEPSKNPISETDETKGKTVYAVSKLAGEELTKGYHQMYPGLNFTIVRFFNTYGEGQVAQFVLAKFVAAVLDGTNPVVYGDGGQRRGYGHVDDITDGLLEILLNPKAMNKTYNLGNSEEVYTLKELAQKVIDVLAPDSGLEVDVLGDFIGTDRTEEREIYTRFSDTSRAKDDFGFLPKITVDEGIRRIANHGVIHIDWADARTDSDWEDIQTA